jgi:hypothetical protein
MRFRRWIGWALAGGARARRCFGAGAVGIAVAIACEAPAAADAKDPIPILPVAMSVVRVDGGPVVDAAWVDAQWAQVERLYDDIGIHFAKRWVEPTRDTLARIETRRDRDAIGEGATPGMVSVFFVQSLRDVDEPERMRMGVCWRSLSDPRRRYVIVASNAKPTVLAHELGHYFGNPHSQVPDNVMSYERTGKPVFFDAAQKSILRATALQWIREGILTVATP